jgi:hypothetical protein
LALLPKLVSTLEERPGVNGKAFKKFGAANGDGVDFNRACDSCR